jgi:hypothetical protein
VRHARGRVNLQSVGRLQAAAALTVRSLCGGKDVGSDPQQLMRHRNRMQSAIWVRGEGGVRV